METQVPDIKSTLARWKEIEENKDKLVDKVENFFKNRKPGKPEDVLPVKITQLRNLLRLALETTSVKEILLFIRYQCARDSKQKNWRSRNFGDDLITAINDVAKYGKQKPNIEMVRRFLGYFVQEAMTHRVND